MYITNYMLNFRIKTLSSVFVKFINTKPDSKVFGY